MTSGALAILIPAFNAERFLGAVVHRVRSSLTRPRPPIIIVNDGSRDHTGRLADRLAAADTGITVLHRSRNGGYGAAMKTALRAAQRLGFETAACIHADGQYAPERLPYLLEQMHAERLDLLQGSRIASGTAWSGGMPVYKIIGNAALNRLERFVLALELTDFHSGYLVYGPRTLRQLRFDHLSDGFEFDLEVIASARAHGLRVGEAPIPTHYGDEVSYLQPLEYAISVLRVLWRYQRGGYAS